MFSVVILKKLLYNLMKKIILRLTKGMCQIAKSDVHVKENQELWGREQQRESIKALKEWKDLLGRWNVIPKEKRMVLGGETSNT